MGLKYFKNYARKRWTAEDWFILNQNPDISEEDCLEFLAWLERDPTHELEYARVETVSSLMSTAAIGMEAVMAEPVSRTTWFRPQMGAAIAASICVLFASIFLFSQLGSDANYYATAVGEQRVITLQDGSVVRLNTNTRAEVLFSDTQRLISLEQGEAFFDVRKDMQNRPFIVSIDDTAVKAIGTEFNIRIQPDSMTVSVLEGVVELLKLGPQSADQQSLSQLSEGFEAIVTEGETAIVSQAPISRNVTSWTSGWSDFSGTPLKSVVEEVNRYSETQIIIADRTLEHLPVNARFMIGKPDQFAEAIAAVYPVTMVKNERVIILRSNKSIDEHKD